jgi:hypothetical protein
MLKSISIASVEIPQPLLPDEMRLHAKADARVLDTELIVVHSIGADLPQHPGSP